MAEKRQFLDIEGVKVICQEFFAKRFSGNYEDLTNKPTIQKVSVDEPTETLIVK